jgi:TIR domain
MNFDRKETLEGLLEGLSVDDDKKLYFLGQKILGEAVALGQQNSPASFWKILAAFDAELHVRAEEILNTMRRVLTGANISDFTELEAELGSLFANSLLPCFNAGNKELEKYRPNFPGIRRQDSIVDVRRTVTRFSPEISLLCAQLETDQSNRVVSKEGKALSPNKAICAMSQNPIAFLSYVRFDDQHEEGRITEFCQRLSHEVQVQTGEEFHIFQDQNDITWGQQWQERINESLDEATFLIPILTPSFFRRDACRGELERFLDREKQLKRNDLILPVYYVDCPLLNDSSKRDADLLAKVIASRQRVDWRELRFEPFTSPDVRKMIAKIAKQIAEALIYCRRPMSEPRPYEETRDRGLPTSDN